MLGCRALRACTRDIFVSPSHKSWPCRQRVVCFGPTSVDFAVSGAKDGSRVADCTNKGVERGPRDPTLPPATPEFLGETAPLAVLQLHCKDRLACSVRTCLNACLDACGVCVCGGGALTTTSIRISRCFSVSSPYPLHVPPGTLAPLAGFQRGRDTLSSCHSNQAEAEHANGQMWIYSWAAACLPSGWCTGHT